MMKFVLTVAVIATAVFFGAARPASAAHYDPTLREWVQKSLETASEDGAGDTRTPKFVYVRCYESRQEFERAYVRLGGSPQHARYVIAYYRGSGGTIDVRAGTCKLASQFVDGWVTQDTAGAFKTILHEALHRQGIHNEKLTEALAITATRSAGQWVEFTNRYYASGGDDSWESWEASAGAGDRAMRLAWQQSQRYIATSYLSSWSYILNLSISMPWTEYAP